MGLYGGGRPFQRGTIEELQRRFSSAAAERPSRGDMGAAVELQASCRDKSEEEEGGAGHSRGAVVELQ